MQLSLSLYRSSYTDVPLLSIAKSPIELPSSLEGVESRDLSTRADHGQTQELILNW